MKKDVLTAQLVESYGCQACKQIVTEDDFLLEHERYWCSKRKQSFSRGDSPHVDCPSWQFNGDEHLIKNLNQPTLE